MKRYHFRIEGSDIQDIDGEVLTDDDEACRVAMVVLSETLPVARDRLLSAPRYAVSVEDEAGRRVAVVAVTLTRF